MKWRNPRAQPARHKAKSVSVCPVPFQKQALCYVGELLQVQLPGIFANEGILDVVERSAGMHRGRFDGLITPCLELCTPHLHTQTHSLADILQTTH